MPENEWWEEDKYFATIEVSSGPMRGAVRDHYPDIKLIIAEAQRRERDKWLIEARHTQAQMSDDGNGMRLIMQLISKMEE
jgi:hypothetical protein